jgi:hypothetical protein
MVGRIPKKLAIGALAALFATGSVADAQSANRTVAVGGVLKVGHYASVNPDCSLLGMPVVRLSVPPTHGVVRTVKKSGFSRFSGPFAQCNARRVAGVSVEYRPERGFAGTDSFSLDIIYASGRERVESFGVTIK